MASGQTNKGKYRMLDGWWRGQNLPTNLYAALCTSATTPNADINTLSELTQIAAGNGYTTNGMSLSRNTTDFDVLTEDDANDRALVQLKDLVWTASGGSLPGSGNGARWLVITDDNATAGSRHVLGWFDLASDRTVSSGQTLTIQDAEFRVA